MQKVSINPYRDPSKPMRRLMKSETMYTLSFKYAVDREEFTNIKCSSFFLQINGVRLFISVNKGYTLNDAIKDMKKNGFTVDTDRVEGCY